MARPTKQGIDYFPLDCRFDDKTEMFLIEKGAKGLAVLVSIWQMIYSNNGYYVENNEDLHLLIKRKIDVDVNSINDCINVGLRRGLFSSDMHEKHGILTSKAVQRRYFDAARRKKEVAINGKYLLISVDSYENIVNVDNNSTNERGNATNVKEKVKVKVKVKGNVKAWLRAETPDGVDEDLWMEWMTVREKKKAVNSSTAIKTLLNKLDECEKAGYQKTRAVTMAINESWKSINPKWIKNKLQQHNDQQHNGQQQKRPALRQL